MLIQCPRHSAPFAMLIAVGALLLPCSMVAADIDGPFGGDGVGDLDGAHTVQEGTEDPNWTGSHTVQEGTNPAFQPWDWRIGFGIPVGFDPVDLSLEEYIALQLGFVEFQPGGGMMLTDNWIEAAIYHYDANPELMSALTRLSSLQLSSGQISNLTGLLVDPDAFVDAILNSDVVYAGPIDPNLPATTGDIPAPGSLVLLAIGGMALARQRRRRTA